MFFDLNVPVLRSSVERDRSALLSQLFQHGYDCVALNTIVFGRLAKQHRCTVERIHFDPRGSSAVGRRRRKATFREPSLLRVTASRSGGGVGAPGHGATAETGPDQVTRLTVVLENPGDAQVLTAGSEALQSYDIVAAVPCCQRSFEVLCKDSDVDVISLPSGKRLPFTITKKNADAALTRGAVFEVTYSQAIQSSSARRYFIGNCQALVSFTRGRGIILASGAESWLHSRTPHDVANLGQLVGLSQEQSLRAVSDTPLAVLRRAEARKSRFRGLAIGGGSADEAAMASLLESLQVPKEFYLPEAVAVAGPKLDTGGVHTPEAGAKGTAMAEGQPEEDGPNGDEDEDDDGGFLSFGISGDMEVDTRQTCATLRGWQRRKRLTYIPAKMADELPALLERACVTLKVAQRVHSATKKDLKETKRELRSLQARHHELMQRETTSRKNAEDRRANLEEQLERLQVELDAEVHAREASESARRAAEAKFECYHHLSMQATAACRYSQLIPHSKENELLALEERLKKAEQPLEGRLEAARKGIEVDKDQMFVLQMAWAGLRATERRRAPLQGWNASQR
eukprot:g17224.t1